jgi:hypothetical protein
VHRELILKVFEKARKEKENKTGILLSNSKLAEYVSDTLMDKFKCSFGEKSLSILYNNARSNNKDRVEVKQLLVLESLCKYLGYDNYVDFSKSNLVSTNNNKLPAEKENNNWGKVAFQILNKNRGYLILIIISASLFYIFSLNNPRWMIWENDQYIEVEFDTKKYDLGHLKIYKEERIKFFKKITPDCDVKYFENNGKVRIWYGKNSKGTFEVFTSLGLHPETGKTLKPITQYMIDKYFCDK